MAKRSITRRKTTPGGITVKTELPEATNPLIDGACTHGTISNVRDVLQFLSVAGTEATDGSSEEVKAGLYWIHVCLQGALRHAEAQAQGQIEVNQAVIAAALKKGVRL